MEDKIELFFFLLIIIIIMILQNTIFTIMIWKYYKYWNEMIT